MIASLVIIALLIVLVSTDAGPNDSEPDSGDKGKPAFLNVDSDAR
jgi:hypothetical protein